MVNGSSYNRGTVLTCNDRYRSNRLLLLRVGVVVVEVREDQKEKETTEEERGYCSDNFRKKEFGPRSFPFGLFRLPPFRTQHQDTLNIPSETVVVFFPVDLEGLEFLLLVGIKIMEDLDPYMDVL